MRRVRVGLAQVNPTVGAVEANARLVMAGMDRARALGCDFVAFPELVLTGYPPEDLLFKPAFIEANLRAGADVARAGRGITPGGGFAGKGRFREKMLATRAADDLVCLAFVNTVGGQDELIFDGQSFIFNEKGECVARGKPFEEDFVVADLDLDEVFRSRLHDSRRRKEKLRATEPQSRRVALSPRPKPERPQLPLPQVPVLQPLEEIYQALVLGTLD